MALDGFVEGALEGWSGPGPSPDRLRDDTVHTMCDIAGGELLPDRERPGIASLVPRLERAFSAAQFGAGSVRTPAAR